jgi:hypothetical protein
VPLSINSNTNKEFDIKLYPNPINNVLFIEPFLISNRDKLYLNIFDVSGRIILKLDYIPEYINFSDYKNGIYIVQITNYSDMDIREKVAVIR